LHNRACTWAEVCKRCGDFRRNEETRLARRETTVVEPRYGSAAESASGIAIVSCREASRAIVTGSCCARVHALTHTGWH
jgi:hypothetical protein